jgi:Protein of unknown function (DUF1648)
MTRWFVVSISLTALTVAGALALGLVWPNAFQDRIPIHWDINMQPDGWVTRDAFLPYLPDLPRRDGTDGAAHVAVAPDLAEAV